MILNRVRSPFEAVVVYDTYSDDQLSEIFKELDFLTNKRVMRPPIDTGSALDKDGNPIKKNKAIFLYESYCNEAMSPILTHTKKLFSEEICKVFSKINPIHEIYSKVNSHSTLLSYYENSDKYEYHRDESLYTSVTYLFREPKSFSGGEISFKLGEEVESFDIKNNMSIIFPSIYYHSVSQVVMDKNLPEFSGMGRYCISQFINFIPR